jgi:hypothetical protein
MAKAKAMTKPHQASTPGFSQWAIEEMRKFAESLKKPEPTKAKAKAKTLNRR